MSTTVEPDRRATDRPRDFLREIVARHVEEGRYPEIVTRFPPEPNGFPTIGHAKALALSYGIAEEYGGTCNLRFDDTNPTTEKMEYVEAFKRDLAWLGYPFGERVYFASDYFEQLYDFALVLIDRGLAYVDSLNEEEIREYRGTVTEPGRESPYRDRSREENRDLFERMRKGEFEDGAHVLRARIDMGHENMVMRDPILWRIRHATHYRRGDEWCIYPLYDFTHCLSDAIEGISHSFCTLEFESNRELYDWILEKVGFEEPRPHQYEFSRLFLDYTVVSKRKLLRLVDEGHVAGWDDPRMPTLSGLRRRGITPEAIRAFAAKVGITRVNGRTDIKLLEHSIRDDLNTRVPRVMAVVDPLRVVITNWPADAKENGIEWLDAPLYPHDVPLEGTRPLPFGGELWIERSDFEENPPEGFTRLTPGAEVRLRYAYLVTCTGVVKDDQGRVIEVQCTYDPATRGGDSPDGRTVRGTIHWVARATALPATFRLYDRLFRVPNPDDVAEGEDWIQHVNPESLVVTEGWVEPSVKSDEPGSRYQFERVGYFVSDPEDSSPEALVYNRTITLRDSWTRAEAPPARKPAPARREPLAEHDPEEAARNRERSGDEAARFDAYLRIGLSATDADVLVRDEELASLFAEANGTGATSSGVLAKWLINEVRPRLGDRRGAERRLEGAALARLVALVEEGKATAQIAREVVAEMVESGGDPAELVAKRAAAVLDDPEALAPIVDSLLAEYPDKAEALRGGKGGLMGFFVGQVMRQTGGKAAAQVVQQLVRDRLGI